MDHEARIDALARIEELERQVSLVRRQLTPEWEKAPRPTGTFQVVRVSIGDGDYAIRCDAVREIVRYARLTAIPGVPAIVPGALNLRGDPVLVLDVPRILRGAEARIDLKTAIVVVEAHARAVGLIVERVLDVVTLNGAELDDPTGPIERRRFIAAVACGTSRLLQVLDLDELFSPGELARIEAEMTDGASHTHASESAAAVTDTDGGWT